MVPEPAAGTLSGMACANALNTTSASLWLVSRFPPDSAAGFFGFSRVPLWGLFSRREVRLQLNPRFQSMQTPPPPRTAPVKSPPSAPRRDSGSRYCRSKNGARRAGEHNAHYGAPPKLHEDLPERTSGVFLPQRRFHELKRLAKAKSKEKVDDYGDGGESICGSPPPRRHKPRLFNNKN